MLTPTAQTIERYFGRDQNQQLPLVKADKFKLREIHAQYNLKLFFLVLHKRAVSYF